LWFKPPAEEEEILSVAEAKSLGVPYGTTKKEAYGMTPSEETKTTSLWKDLTPTTKEDVISWMTEQEGFDVSDITKMNDDTEFANYIVGEYYKQY
jgi:hypothetical protein